MKRMKNFWCWWLIPKIGIIGYLFVVGINSADYKTILWALMLSVLCLQTFFQALALDKIKESLNKTQTDIPDIQTRARKQERRLQTVEQQTKTQ